MQVDAVSSRVRQAADPATCRNQPLVYEGDDAEYNEIDHGDDDKDAKPARFVTTFTDVPHDNDAEDDIDDGYEEQKDPPPWLACYLACQDDVGYRYECKPRVFGVGLLGYRVETERDEQVDENGYDTPEAAEQYGQHAPWQQVFEWIHGNWHLLQLFPIIHDDEVRLPRWTRVSYTRQRTTRAPPSSAQAVLCNISTG